MTAFDNGFLISHILHKSEKEAIQKYYDSTRKRICNGLTEVGVITPETTAWEQIIEQISRIYATALKLNIPAQPINFTNVKKYNLASGAVINLQIPLSINIQQEIPQVKLLAKHSPASGVLLEIAIGTFRPVAADNKCAFSWTAEPQASKYRVWQSSDGIETYTVLGETDRTDFIMDGLQNGETYYFKITAVISKGGNA